MSLGFGFVIGGCVIAVVMTLLIELRRDAVLKWGRALKAWWHEGWAEHHERILLKLDEDGGLDGQYFSKEYTYHYRLYNTLNWYALALCLDGDDGEDKGITSEVALIRMGIKEKRVDKGCVVLDEGARDMARDMIRLKGKGLTYEEIAVMYKINKMTVFRRIKKYRERG